MFWHIDTDIISLFVMVTLYAQSIKEMLVSRVQNARDKSFLWCLRSGVFVTLIDIVASVVMEIPTNSIVFHIAMTLYFVTIELVILEWFNYSLAIIWHDSPRARRALNLCALAPYVVYAVVVMSSPLTGLIYSLSDDGVYARGPLFLSSYVLFAIYTVTLFLLVYIRRKHIPPGYSGAVLLLIPTITAVGIVVQLAVPGWLTIMPCYMICLVLAFNFLQSVRLKNEKATMQQFAEIAENVMCGFIICTADSNGTTVRYFNDKYAAFFEQSHEALMKAYDKDMTYAIHPEDRKKCADILSNILNDNSDYEIAYRIVTQSGKTKWLFLKAKITFHGDGTATTYSTCTEITEQIELQQQMADLVYSVPCGICLYRRDGDELHPLIINTRFTEMIGEEAEGYLEKSKGFNYSHVHPDDLENIRNTLKEALSEKRELDVTYRSYNSKSKEYLWIHMRGAVMSQLDGTQLVYISYYDVTQEHLVEKKLRESEQALEYATSQAGLLYWRYDIVNDCVYADARYCDVFGLPLVIENFSENWNSIHVALPEYVNTYRNAYEKIRAGEKQVIFEMQCYLQDKSLHWVRCCFTNLFDENGNVNTAVCTSIPIDSEKELWAKYELERNRKTLESDNLLVHAMFDLTTGETLEYTYRDGTQVPLENRDVFSYSSQNVDFLIDNDERREFLELNNVDRLLERFAKGETEFKLDYRRRLQNGEVIWVRSSLYLLRAPRNSDVILFEYWYDIEEEKMQELMYRSIATDNYDFVAKIDGVSKSFVVLPKEGLSCNMPPLFGADADNVTYTLFNECVLPEDKELAINNCLVQNIKKNLLERGRFHFIYREIEPGGVVRYKRMTQYYIDRQREIIVMTREDVTDLIRAEAEKNEILASALETANQASEAKSQFLSRVSHELRTPLNAILGFIELAKGADAQRIDNYMNYSDIAAKQLLSIINDVLDMSSIESGKLKIAYSPFDIENLIHSITNIYFAQCDEKGLEYETQILTPLNGWLIGDQLRVNQILINLLGNAIKFTDSGSVRLRVSQSETQNNKVIIHFEVNDTGCGMSEEMQKRLFKPFEQENHITAQRYGGNGLGLSIVYNLVNMMGGAIRVESERGKGTTFFVDLPFSKSERFSDIQLPAKSEQLRVLAVDYDENERRYISVVLTRMGVRHTCVADGDDALTELSSALVQNDEYSVCLIDWKMPTESGIELTKRIRDKYNKDISVIIMSAFDHNPECKTIKTAGADMYISKPLFKSTLFDALMTLTDGRISAHDENVQRSFHDKRILLAEDNVMNRIVAKGLIERLGVECECADDGKIAVEKFSSSKPGYYDAILMDIQMPNMNGFEATRAIRASSHEQAKSVQIIALTANAFSEDIAKTLSSGMNAHVAKPIEPDVLSKALAEAFSANS